MRKLLGSVLFVAVWAMVHLVALPAVYSQSPTPIPLPPGESVLACTNNATPTLVPPDRAICPPATPTATRTATPSPTVTATATAVPTPLPGFLETFDGAPVVPAPWNPADWDIAVHSRDRETWIFLNSMVAQHGLDCDPPPESHIINTYEEAVFLCRNHMMSSINSGSGYAVIYLTPNQLVDFSAGEAVIRFDMSTLRTSNRDWVDLWITPYQDNLVTPLEDWLPDLNGEPRRAIHIRMRFGSAGNLIGAFEGYIINDFDDTVIPLRRNSGYEGIDGFIPSSTQRQTFELRISRTHIKFGMPAPGLDFWWIDADIPPLSWSSGIVQFGHHSYNPTKDCSTCRPNTWHWDNVSISPAVPFTIIRADRRFVDTTSPAALTFPAPAPAGSHLRFSGIGNSLEISTSSNGQTWTAWKPAEPQAQEESASDHFRSYWTPIPEGTRYVRFRGTSWWGGRWHIRGASIWSISQDD